MEVELRDPAGQGGVVFQTVLLHYILLPGAKNRGLEIGRRKNKTFVTFFLEVVKNVIFKVLS